MSDQPYYPPTPVTFVHSGTTLRLGFRRQRFRSEDLPALRGIILAGLPDGWSPEHVVFGPHLMRAINFELRGDLVVVEVPTAISRPGALLAPGPPEGSVQ